MLGEARRSCSSTIDPRPKKGDGPSLPALTSLQWVRSWRELRVQPKSAFSPFVPVHRADLAGRQRLEIRNLEPRGDPRRHVPSVRFRRRSARAKNPGRGLGLAASIAICRARPIRPMRESDMTPQERQMLGDLFERVKAAGATPRDAEAEAFINDAVHAAPFSPYVASDRACPAASSGSRGAPHLRSRGGPAPKRRPGPGAREFSRQSRQVDFRRRRPQLRLPRPGRAMTRQPISAGRRLDRDRPTLRPRPKLRRRRVIRRNPAPGALRLSLSRGAEAASSRTPPRPRRASRAASRSATCWAACSAAIRAAAYLAAAALAAPGCSAIADALRR